jgi:hypothetical protein
MMYSLLLSVFIAARMFTELLPSNDDIPLLYKWPVCHNTLHSNQKDSWVFLECNLKNIKEHNVLETGSVSKMLCYFVFFRIPDDGQGPKNPLILSFIHHRWNPLESTQSNQS